MKYVTIDRKKWGRYYLLHGSSGKMCCMGFCAIELKATKEEIKGYGLPYEVQSLAEEFHNEFGINDSCAYNLAQINDGTMKDREGALNKCLEDDNAKVRFRFVN